MWVWKSLALSLVSVCLVVCLFDVCNYWLACSCQSWKSRVEKHTFGVLVDCNLHVCECVCVCMFTDGEDFFQNRALAQNCHAPLLLEQLFGIAPFTFTLVQIPWKQSLNMWWFQSCSLQRVIHFFVARSQWVESSPRKLRPRVMTHPFLTPRDHLFGKKGVAGGHGF